MPGTLALLPGLAGPEAAGRGGGAGARHGSSLPAGGGGCRNGFRGVRAAAAAAAEVEASSVNGGLKNSHIYSVAQQLQRFLGSLLITHTCVFLFRSHKRTEDSARLTRGQGFEPFDFNTGS